MHDGLHQSQGGTSILPRAIRGWCCYAWAVHDPTLAASLPNIPDNATGQYAEAFYRHMNRVRSVMK